MSIHLYCLLQASAEPPPPDLRGVDGAPVMVVTAPPLAAWVSRVGDDREATIARVRAHDVVTTAALDGGTTPVPIRFGQRFGDESEVQTLLERRRPAIEQALEQVAGTVEMDLGIELAMPDADASDLGAPLSTPGRRYLEAIGARLRLERIMHARAEPLRSRISGVLRGVVQQETAAIRSSPRAVLQLSHLVPRSAVSRYRALVEPFAFEEGVRSFVLLGPVAPYHFVTLDG